MKRNIALVLVGLVIGCGAGAVATQRATAQGFPGGPLPAAAPPQRWQQFCEQVGSVQDASAVAAARGVDGFEMVAMYNGVLCFKRPLTVGAAGPATPQATPPSVPTSFPGY
jgi:hypothetical protein